MKQNRALEELVRNSALCGLTPLVFRIVPPSVEAGEGSGVGRPPAPMKTKPGRDLSRLVWVGTGDCQ